MRPVALPDDTLLYSGSDLGGWLTGTFDGVPKVVGLDHLSFALPAPFPVEEGLLALPEVESGKRKYGLTCD